MFTQLYPIVVDKPKADRENLPSGLTELSRDAVRSAHKRWRASLHKQVDKALDKAGHAEDEERRTALTGYLTRSRMWRKQIGGKELADVAALAPAAIRQETPAPPFTVREAIAQRKVAAASPIRHEHEELFGDHWRLYYQMEPDTSHKSATHKEVEDYLTQLGYTDLDYNKGLVTDDSGQRRKIGRLLRTSNAALADAFSKDGSRGSRRQMMVLSRHPYDLARMSTGRGWASCMTKDSAYWESVPAEWEHGSVIAYLTSIDDPNLANPQARMLFKPFVNEEGEAILRPYDTYGIKSHGFRAAAINLIDQTVNAGKLGRFEKPQGLYADMQPTRMMRISPDMSASDFIQAVTGKRPLKRLDGTMVHNGNLSLTYHALGRLPDLSMLEVKGNLTLKGLGLTTLEGAPYRVHGKCDVSNNKLTSLEGAPQQVGRFDCSNNRLTSLKGGPKQCGSLYRCTKNNLQNLAHLPDTMGFWSLPFARLHTDFGFWMSKGAIYPAELRDPDFVSPQSRQDDPPKPPSGP
ncbi:MAG: hypothetical protein Alpg2KO_22780 [Alphaproteobacteria bacterium]